jgi:hypothetical protein
MYSHCLFPVVVTSLEQVVINLFTRLMTVTDLLQVVPTRLIQAARNKLLRACCHQLVTCRRYQACWNNLLRVCWPHQPCYKMITCSRLVNNWEQAVRTHLSDFLYTTLDNYIFFAKVRPRGSSVWDSVHWIYSVIPKTNIVFICELHTLWVFVEHFELVCPERRGFLRFDQLRLNQETMDVN